MSLFAAWSSTVLGAARLDQPAARPPAAPEPRRFRLAYNPVLPTPSAPARRAGPVAEPALASARIPPSSRGGRLRLEK
ncbi:hypothetical protein JHL17_31780 [Azospirillum sp. YIM B02556]|uniref:Uncharacterized protein n=1 Tax=Azospirillum endophyticum TaxID=2800326 RepID=A0ABS1FEY1_9PROT|nr:hypothetical protein [Azospirillum endophyticum]MBK1841987.1 hypothetical protein [Azospirillum endophyticum]